MNYILKIESDLGNIYRFNIDNDYFYIKYHKGDKYKDSIIWYTTYDFNKDSNIKTFKISKEYEVLYNLLDNLYNDIKNCNIFLNEEKNTYIKNIQKYMEHPIFINDQIVYHSDDEDYGASSILNIYKEEENYIVKFMENKNTRYAKFNVVISNNNTRYRYFNFLFNNMFNELNSYYEENHQMTCDEYLTLKKRLNK